VFLGVLCSRFGGSEWWGEIIFKMSCSVCGSDNRKSSVRVIVVHLGGSSYPCVRSENVALYLKGTVPLVRFIYIVLYRSPSLDQLILVTLAVYFFVTALFTFLG
jgi:hypothetical protein